MEIASAETLAKMEQIIKEDLDIILRWMHPAWFRLFLENKRMQEVPAQSDQTSFATALLLLVCLPVS
jgi:hypothetical protein